MREALQPLDDLTARGDASLSPRGWGVSMLAIALAIGIALGRHQSQSDDGPLVWPWLIAAAIFWLLTFITRRHSPLLGLPLLSISMMLLGAGWYSALHERTTPDNLMAWVGDERLLVRVEGTALSPPVLRARTAGSMAKFDYREPATYFRLRVDALIDRHQQRVPIHGEVLVRADETVQPFRAGSKIAALGFLTRPVGPRNPGEFDYRDYAKSLGQAGILTVAGRDLLSIEPAPPRHFLLAAYLNAQHHLRLKASAWLRADLPETERTERDSMLANLLLGERDAQIDGWYESFQRVGLAHIMAISGFHLSVLAGFVLLTARLIGGSRRMHGWLVIAIVLLYLFLVEVRMPVLRAGVMTIAGCLGLIFSRRLRVGGLVSFSAILLLLWKPDQAFNAGFQLTYGTVLGLIHLVPPVRARWFGRPDPEAATVGEMFKQWFCTALVVSIVAWLIATPIAVWHFGMISPLGIVLSVVAVPLSAVILMLGYIKIVLSAILPSAALLLGIPLALGADVLLSLVMTADKLPLAVVQVPPPSSMWTLLAIAAVMWWCLARSKPACRFARISIFILAIWLCLPLLPINFTGRSALRIDMFAVGDGSCYVLRQGGSTVVFDAGSSTDLNAGRRSIIPAMRRLGVHAIDAIAISHANLDHYSAVLELAGEFNIRELLVAPQLLAEVENDPLGPISHVLAGLSRNRVTITPIHRGSTRDFGGMKWTWLHPGPDDSFSLVNDRSQVIRVDSNDKCVLLCGDIQRTAMAELLSHTNQPQLIADVMELPHHGSHHEAAVEFVSIVKPSLVLQSTGWGRWSRDEWSDEFHDITRLVTARDGACWARIEPDGSITHGTFLRTGEHVGGDQE